MLKRFHAVGPNINNNNTDPFITNFKNSTKILSSGISKYRMNSLRKILWYMNLVLFIHNYNCHNSKL